jgi:hypothetical protein
VKTSVTFFTLLIVLVIHFTVYGESSRDEQLKELNQYINDTDDGSDFNQAVMLQDTADYGQCQTDKCVIAVFKRTVFEEECAYLSRHFGKQGEGWEIVGHSKVEAEIFLNKKYYDDLGIRVTATGRKKVIRFNITNLVGGLKKRLGSRWQENILLS